MSKFTLYLIKSVSIKVKKSWYVTVPLEADSFFQLSNGRDLDWAVKWVTVDYLEGGEEV